MTTVPAPNDRPRRRFRICCGSTSDLIDNLVGVEVVLDGAGIIVTPPVMRGPHVDALATFYRSGSPPRPPRWRRRRGWRLLRLAAGDGL